MADLTRLPHFTHTAANVLNRFGIPHQRESDGVITLWRRGDTAGLVTVYRRGIADKLTVILRLSSDGQTIVDAEVLE